MKHAIIKRGVRLDKRKILFADDDPEIREVVRILLESEGYQVVEAENGEQAASAADDTFDLIILDVMMPGRNGFSACAEIRRKLNTPILFLTARTQDSDKTMGFGAGGDDYLAKPFSYTELVARVKAMLRRYYVYQGGGNRKKMTHRYKSGICFLIRTAVRCVWREEKFFLRIWNTGFSFFSRRTGGRFLRYRISMRAFGKNRIITFPITR